MNERLVSINIPFLNRIDSLSRCVESIEKYTPRDLYELVLINDGSTDEQTVEYAKSHADVFVNHTEQMGVAKGRYDGVNASSCRYVCTCDSDIIVPPRWLEKLLSTFTMDHLHPDLTKLYDVWLTRRIMKCGIDVKILAPLQYGRVSQWMFGPHFGTPNWLLLTQEVGCYCMLFEKSLVDSIGNFDVDFYNILEDLDFSRKVSWNVFNLPDNPVVALDTRVVVYHHGWVEPLTGVFQPEQDYDRTSVRVCIDGPIKTIPHQIRSGIAVKKVYDRWGAKHSSYDIYMEILKQNGIDTETPLCESFAKIDYERRMGEMFRSVE
jgi:glycosyltransferase involved in cell wall biosynthesis